MKLAAGIPNRRWSTLSIRTRPTRLVSWILSFQSWCYRSLFPRPSFVDKIWNVVSSYFLNLQLFQQQFYRAPILPKGVVRKFPVWPENQFKSYQQNEISNQRRPRRNRHFYTSINSHSDWNFLLYLVQSTTEPSARWSATRSLTASTIKVLTWKTWIHSISIENQSIHSFDRTSKRQVRQHGRMVDGGNIWKIPEARQMFYRSIFQLHGLQWNQGIDLATSVDTHNPLAGCDVVFLVQN